MSGVRSRVPRGARPGPCAGERLLSADSVPEATRGATGPRSGAAGTPLARGGAGGPCAMRPEAAARRGRSWAAPTGRPSEGPREPRGRRAVGGREQSKLGERRTGRRGPGRRVTEPRAAYPSSPPPAPEVYSLLTAFMWINLILALTQSSEGGRGDYTGGSRCERDLRCGNSRMLPRRWVSPVRARAVLGATRPARSPALEIAHVANTS